MLEIGKIYEANFILWHLVSLWYWERSLNFLNVEINDYRFLNATTQKNGHFDWLLLSICYEDTVSGDSVKYHVLNIIYKFVTLEKI